MKNLCRIIDREYYDCLDSHVNIFLLCHCIWYNGEDNGTDFQKHHIHMKELGRYFGPQTSILELHPLKFLFSSIYEGIKKFVHYCHKFLMA